MAFNVGDKVTRPDGMYEGVPMIVKNVRQGEVNVVWIWYGSRRESWYEPRSLVLVEPSGPDRIAEMFA